jgi:HTH-type transcriptional regulator/antitoxin HigA
MNSNFNPSWASNPADTIRDLLFKKGMSLSSLPTLLNTSEEVISKILGGQTIIDNETAENLAENLGFSSFFWINRFNQYKEDLERLNVEQKAMWLKNLPLKDMIKSGWIKNGPNLIEECLNFFGCSSVSDWEDQYGTSISQFAFRSSGRFPSKLHPTTAWLRYGELVADKMVCSSWNAEKFLQEISRIRSLTRSRTPKHFLPKLIQKCANSGVALVIAKTPSGCSMSGAAKILNKDKRLILLSFRYLSDDQFWFTFFHEVGHLILHDNVDVFIDDDLEEVSSYEREANNFAGEILIPFENRDEINSMKRDKRSIVSLASQLGVSPGILIGQMQHYGLISPNYMNGYKRRFKWDEINEGLNQ